MTIRHLPSRLKKWSFLFFLFVFLGGFATASSGFAACEYLSSGDFSSGSGWFVESTDYWSIVSGMLDAHNTGTASTYAKTDFYPDGFFSVDVDIDIVSATGEHDRVGVMFRTSDSANDLFVVNGDSGNYTTKRILCYYYPHTGLLKFKVDDVSAGWVVPLAARPVTDHVESIGLSMVPDGVIFRINSQDTNYKLTGNFSFGPSVVVKVLLYAGGTGLHARFDNVCASSYEVSDCLPGNAMPLPTEPKLFPTYNPIEKPIADSDPAYAQPIGTGDIAWGGGTVTIQIGTCPCTEPVNLYFALQLSTIPDELYMLTSDGTLQPYSLVGLAPWKTQVTEAVHETPFGDLRMSDLPPGTYYLYLVAAPVGTFDNFYLWSTFFEIPGAPAPTNIKPYLDQVIDDIVIDFGRLDGKRRNLGVGPALGAIPVHPNPGNTIGPQNLCTYINGGTYLKTLPLSDPNHINPDQYPDGMTCVFAVVADGDAEALNFQHILPEPMFGRGNIYTAIPIPGGVPAGTLIDNYETLNVYNSMVSTYANSGLLSVQPHIRSTTAPEELRQFTAPVEPLRTPPQEFPYVIAFSQGGNPNGIPVVAGQTLTETPNPLGLQPSGTIFKVIVEEGSWGQGNARGYIWMIPVTDDFWDLRHSNGTGDPGLWVSGQRVATLTYVGQAIPIIWEAPDDPNVEQSTHDRRHVNPDAIPAGGTVQLEARVQDSVNPQETAFALVAWPVDDGNLVIIDQNSGNCKCVVEWDHFKPDDWAMHFDAISHDLNAHIELNFASGTITGAFSGTLVTEYVPLWHQSYLQPFACEGSYSGQIVSGAIETYENDEGETHGRFTGDVNIHLELTGGRTLKRWDSSQNEWVTYYVEGTENVNVVGEIKGSTESGSLRIVWMQVINATMPQGFYLTWYGLSSLFNQ